MNSGPWGAPPPRRRPSRLGVALWFAGLAGIVLLLWLLARNFPEQDSPLGDAYLWRLVAILAMVSSGLLFIRDINLKTATRNILLWVGVAGVLMIGFTYQDELRGMALRLRSDLIPGSAVGTGNHELTISESDGGSYFVYGAINGTPVRFLIDTGASEIVLSPADAQRAGIDLDRLTFDRPYESANGIGRGARSTLSSLTVGPLNFADVDVSVNGAAMSSSLLGMTFLKRLKSFQFGDRKLVLRW